MELKEKSQGRMILKEVVVVRVSYKSIKNNRTNHSGT